MDSTTIGQPWIRILWRVTNKQTTATYLSLLIYYNCYIIITVDIFQLLHIYHSWYITIATYLSLLIYYNCYIFITYDILHLLHIYHCWYIPSATYLSLLIYVCLRLYCRAIQAPFLCYPGSLSSSRSLRVIGSLTRFLHSPGIKPFISSRFVICVTWAQSIIQF